MPIYCVFLCFVVIFTHFSDHDLRLNKNGIELYFNNNSLSFLSQMPAIHDFGLFMMLIVISCWLTVISIIPPVLYLWYKYIDKLEKRCFKLLFGWIPLKSCRTQRELPGIFFQKFGILIIITIFY